MSFGFEKITGAILTAGGALFLADAIYGFSEFSQVQTEIMGVPVTGAQAETFGGAVNVLGGIMLLIRGR